MNTHFHGPRVCLAQIMLKGALCRGLDGAQSAVAQILPGEADERCPVNIVPMGKVVFGSMLRTAEPCEWINHTDTPD